MNSKDRVRIAMSGGVPDRVPVLPQICPPHAVRAAGLPFRDTIVDFLRDPRRYDLLVGDRARAYGVDGFRVWVGGPARAIEWKDGKAYEIDPSSCERTGIVDFEGGGGVLLLPEKRRMLTVEDIDAIPVVPAEALAAGDAMAPVRKAIDSFGADLFVVGVPGSFTVETLSHVQGVEQTLIDIVERPGFIRDITDRQLDAVVHKAIAMASLGVDGFYIGETFGQFMSPKQFASLCIPYFQRFVEQLRPYGKPIYLHMCGRITHLIDLIPETGVDCLEPLDVVAGVSAAQVKNRIGSRLALMGGVSTVTLSIGSVEDVRREYRRCIREAGEGGGYILAACDMLPTETSAEKVKAMVEAAERFGSYDSSGRILPCPA